MGRDRFEVSLDPFGPNVAFAEGIGPTVQTWFDRCPIVPIDPAMGVADEALVDYERLEELANFQPYTREVREMRSDELSVETEDNLREKEPQFILRNLDRVERYGDPNQPLEYSHDETPDLGMPDSEPLELHEQLTFDIGEYSSAYAARHHKWTRWMAHGSSWAFRWGKEHRSHYRGPAWGFDPFEKAAEDGRELDEIPMPPVPDY